MREDFVLCRDSHGRIISAPTVFNSQLIVGVDAHIDPCTNKKPQEKSCGFSFKFNYLNFLLRAASDFFFLLTEGFS